MIVRSSAVLLLSVGLTLAPLRVSAQASTPASPASSAPSASPASPASGPAPATGDEKAANFNRAKELYRNGERLYTEGSYESAILAFQESYELSKEPQLLYNIGNAYERLGDFGNARRYLDQYRAFAPEKEREALSRRIQTLDQRQREKEQKERDAAAAAAVEKNNTPAQPVTTTPADPGKRDAGAAKRDPIYGPAAIALTAGVVIGLGLGVGFGIKANGEKKTALDGCMDGANDALFCSTASQDALDKRKTSALVADIGFAVAGAAAIGLITVIALKAVRKNRSSQRAQLVPHAGPRGAGLTLGVRF